MNEKYPIETLDENDDDGTMPENVAELAKTVVGHRIVSAERIERSAQPWLSSGMASFVLTLDNGQKVELTDGGDCCAYTEVKAFLLNPARVDHVITGVGTTEGYTRWHIYADMGDVLEMTVGWSCGNPFYYGYGFNIGVSEVTDV